MTIWRALGISGWAGRHTGPRSWRSGGSVAAAMERGGMGQEIKVSKHLYEYLVGGAEQL